MACVFLVMLAALMLMDREPARCGIQGQYAVNRAAVTVVMQAITSAARSARRCARHTSEIGQDKWVCEEFRHHNPRFSWMGIREWAPSGRIEGVEARGRASASIPSTPTGKVAHADVQRTWVDVAGPVVKWSHHSGLGGIADTLGRWKEEARSRGVATTPCWRHPRTREGAGLYSLSASTSERRRARALRGMESKNTSSPGPRWR